MVSTTLVVSVFSLVIGFLAADDVNCASALPKQIESILNNASYETATWGMEIVGYQGGEREELFSLLKNNFRVPASNTKLLTTSALFSLVDVNKEHFETPVYYSEENGGKNLCIKGSGDPSLTYHQMEELAKLLSLEGFRDVKDLILDNTLFYSNYGQGQPFLESWQWEDIGAAYGAHPNSPMVEENAFYITVSASSIGSPPTLEFSVPSSVITVKNTAVTVKSNDPRTLQVYWKMGAPYLTVEGNIPSGEALGYHLAAIDSDDFYISLFQQALGNEGINVEQILVGECNTSSKIVGVMASQAWNVLFNHTLQESDNFYAEAWLRALGLTFYPTSSDPPAQRGLNAVSAVLSQNLGVSESCHRQVDGCGVSVQNLVSPHCIMEILEGVDNLPNGQEYFDFLPLAGESGTLSSRFVGTDAQGRVRAKTGTITGVNALSGSVDNPNYDTLLFSILVNESNQPASVIRQGIDTIVELLPDLDPSC